MQDETEVLNSLMEEHESDFEPAQEDSKDEGDNTGGDNSQDNSKNETNGADNSSKDTEVQYDGDKSTEPKDESGEDKSKPVEFDDSENAETELMGEKKDANYRIRQLVEKQKEAERRAEELAAKLAEKEAAELKEQEAKEDPVYTIDDFIGTVNENGDPLTDGEANARFKAWEADYKFRQLQKETLLKEQQNTLISLQRETAEAFTKFPEFDINSDKYDEKLARLANRMFEAGLQYDSAGRIIGSKVNPGQLLAELHELRAATTVPTKVNNLPSEDSKIISSQQANKKSTKYEPGFRGEVDKEIDKLIKREN